MNLKKKTLLYWKKKKKVFSLKKQDEKEQLSGQSSSVRFWYKAYEKSNTDLLFKENLTKASTPVARKTRSNIAATEVDVKGKKRSVSLGLESTYRLIVTQMKIWLQKNMGNLKKKINNLLNKLRIDEQGILFAKGESIKKLENSFEK